MVISVVYALGADVDESWEKTVRIVARRKPLLTESHTKSCLHLSHLGDTAN